MSFLRVGYGYDVHKFCKDRKLIIGGVEIPSSVGLLGHSDADVLLHAIMDALLGAAAKGDIGLHFPDDDIRYKDANSLELLERVCGLIANEGYIIENIDATIVMQAPKLRPYIELMKTNIAKICGTDINQINVKATTEEGLGFTGSMQGVAAHAVCLLKK